MKDPLLTSQLDLTHWNYMISNIDKIFKNYRLELNTMSSFFD